jgi:hypothetical protein
MQSKSGPSRIRVVALFHSGAYLPESRSVYRGNDNPDNNQAYHEIEKRVDAPADQSRIRLGVNPHPFADLGSGPENCFSQCHFARSQIRGSDAHNLTPIKSACTTKFMRTTRNKQRATLYIRHG